MNKPRYSTNKYILMITGFATVGLILSLIILQYFYNLIGISEKELIKTIFICFPIFLFCCLKGFYLGLVKYYGFKDPFKKESDLNH